MSMHNYACDGYTVRAIELAPLLPESKRQEFLERIDRHEGEDLEELQKWFAENRKLKSLPCPELMFLRHEDESEDLEYDVIYAYFSEEELFVREPTKACKRLVELNITPVRSRWVVWG